VDSSGTKEPCIRWGPPQGKGQFLFGRHVRTHCEVQGISVVSQSYSLGGNSDAAVRCQYCSNLLAIRLTAWTMSTKYRRLLKQVSKRMTWKWVVSRRRRRSNADRINCNETDWETALHRREPKQLASKTYHRSLWTTMPTFWRSTRDLSGQRSALIRAFSSRSLIEYTLAHVPRNTEN